MGFPSGVDTEEGCILTILREFRSLNAMTKWDTYPIPRIQECVDSLRDAKFSRHLTVTSVTEEWN